MKFENVKIKENISFKDKIDAIEYITSAHFNDGNYMPYMSEPAQIVAIMNYFVDGYEIEDNDGIIDIYDNVVNTKLLFNIASKFYHSENMTDEYKEYRDIMDFVMFNVKEKVEFSKKVVIANTESQSYTIITDRMIDVLDKEYERLVAEIDTQKTVEDANKAVLYYMEQQKEVTDQFTPDEQAELLKKFSEANFDVNAVADEAVNKYVNSKQFAEKQGKIIDMKQSAKNVTPDKKGE